MQHRGPILKAGVSLSRRRFVQGLTAGGVLLGLPAVRAAGQAQHTRGPAILRGTEFNLEVAESRVNFTGTTQRATVINGSIPAPTLVWRAGDTVTMRVTNHLPVPTSLHWHGIILPYQMDGVPGVSFPGIGPGETFTYHFTVRQAGTYWYHSHSGFQEMTGMYGAIIVVPAGGETIRAHRDYVMQLSDWSDIDPHAVFTRLKQQSDYYNINRPTVSDFFRDISRYGLSETWHMRRMWNEMRMNPTDLADLSAVTLTYLLNGATAADNWTGLFHPGERVRLRFINGAGNTFYDVRIPGLPLRVVQVDGQDIEPVTVDEFRFGPGETHDVLVDPVDDAYTIFAQSMDRTGFTRGTLAVRQDISAPVPSLDALAWLSMADMMGEMGHNAHDGAGHVPMRHGTESGFAAPAQHQHGLAVPSRTVRHARTEYGPSVDMRVDTPRTNVDDPGVGLRANGRRVLVAADLRGLGGPLDTRLPGREIELHLTGNMERYSWSFDGLEFGASTPVTLHHGERLRVILQNDTMMVHPMHLHGMWSEHEDDQGRFLARRHTIPVQPAQRVSFLVTADALGRWAWHCHLLFHAEAGMFREVVVA